VANDDGYSDLLAGSIAVTASAGFDLDGGTLTSAAAQSGTVSVPYNVLPTAAGLISGTLVLHTVFEGKLVTGWADVNWVPKRFRYW